LSLFLGTLSVSYTYDANAMLTLAKPSQLRTFLKPNYIRLSAFKKFFSTRPLLLPRKNIPITVFLPTFDQNYSNFMKLKEIFYSPIDYEKNNDLSVPTQFSQAGIGTFHQGSVGHGGNYPHTYIDSLASFNQIELYSKLKKEVLSILENKEETEEKNKDLLILEAVAQVVGNETRKTKDHVEVFHLKINEEARLKNKGHVRLSDFFSKVDGKLYGDCSVTNTLIAVMADDLGVNPEKLYLFYGQDPVVGPMCSAHMNLIYVDKNEAKIIDGFYSILHGSSIKLGNKFIFFEQGLFKYRAGEKRGYYRPCENEQCDFMIIDSPVDTSKE
jgi:hypothetical protein